MADTTMTRPAAVPAALPEAIQAPGLSEAEAARRDAFVGRIFQTLIQSNELLTIYLGDRLGLYRTLADIGPATPAELAASAGTHERYTREWLEQQAVAGIIEVDDARREQHRRRYRLPAGHAEALLDRDSLSYVAVMARVHLAFATPLPELLQAFRTGRGVAFDRYAEDIHAIQAEFSRPFYLNLLTTQWLPGIPELHARLQAGPPARIADLACGAGWSSILMAQGYPDVQVDGFDLAAGAIALGRQALQEAGLDGRVRLQVHDAAQPIPGGPYDLVTIFEALHDMPRPVEVLRGVREVLAPDGTLLIMDMNVPEAFEAPGDDLARHQYATSVLLCLPTGMSEQPSAATGTIMRLGTLRRYAEEAGFQEVEVLPIEHPFVRFYRLHR